MLLSKSCVYGLRASIYLALHADREYVSISEVSEKLGISFHFLTKILQQLTQKGLLTSYRGPNGGVAFVRPARDIIIYDIVAAIDGDDIFTSCILSLPGCGNQTPCPLHESWALIRNKIKTLFLTTSLADLAKGVRENNLRLVNIEQLIQSGLASPPPTNE